MKVVRRALLASDPWLAALGAESADEARDRSPDAREHVVGDVPVRIVELIGEPGDVVIGHPWLLHTPAPNRGDRPRFARVQRIRPQPGHDSMSRVATPGIQ